MDLRRHALVLCAAVIAHSPGQAQSYRMDWRSVNAGGGASSGGGLVLTSSVGQSAAGYVQGTDRKHWIGFWHPGTMAAPQVLARIEEAKTLPDGAYISVAGKIATSGASDFDGFFYLEEADRSSGIRVTVLAWPPLGLQEGSVIQVVGATGTTPAGERQIVASHVVITSTAPPLQPLGMIQRTIGGGDFGAPPLGQYGVTGGAGVNTVGLLIRAWGLVTESGSGYVTIDDGSGRPLRVDTSTLAVPPAPGTYVTVIGICSLRQEGTPAQRLPLLLPRRPSDASAP